MSHLKRRWTVVSKAKSKSEVQTLSIYSLMQMLAQGEVITLEKNEALKISEFDMNQFMMLVNEEDHMTKLQMIQKFISSFGLVLNLEGTMTVGAFHLEDRSWMIGSGESGLLKISAKVMPLKKTIDELVTFVKKLPQDQALVLRVGQDLLIEGLNSDSVVNYYELSKNATDPKVLEKIQDEFFFANSKLLQEENLNLKVFAYDATSLNREMNSELGLMVMRAHSTDETKMPRVGVAVMPKA